MADNKLAGYKLPINPAKQQGTVAQGFVTPKQDRTPQIQAIPPKRVLPIVFIPGIMGSNLRMNAARQKKLGLKNNIAWRPDNLNVTIPQHNDTPSERQLRLDPDTMEVDVYDPVNNPTGDSAENADLRSAEVHPSFVYRTPKRLDGPLIQNDLPGTPNPKTKDQKARERGWGEIYFTSYQEILTACEENLNAAFIYRRMNSYLSQFVVGVSPATWQAEPSLPLKELDEDTIRKAVSGCWFPVHAMGYNWLKGNRESGVVIARRIRNLISGYQQQGYQCEKVILVTHSMGGLTARAVIHPEMGKLNNEVLGIIHGVMPAIGAGTAYKRVRCGFEGSGTSAKILGYIGSHVTPVLANAQGGLELLPSKDYGNNWLQITHKGKTIKSLPEQGDPYKEIYKIRGKWFGLLREDWINPADLSGRGFDATCSLLDKARDFHVAISNTYHDQSFAHYGADKQRMTWHRVAWEISDTSSSTNVDLLEISLDNAKGVLKTIDPTLRENNKIHPEIEIKLLDPADAGDQTVPVHSADAQLRSKKFKGIFRQSGYEHQSSYSNPAVVASTLYSLFQIISTMKWSK